jgi:hypothetical protein
MATILLDTISLTNRDEAQIDWVDQFAWQPIGQSIRYALAGNPVITENPRSGRPITLVAELPWGWLSAATVASLVNLVNQIHYTFVFQWSDGAQYSVRFRRDAVPLVLTPVNPLKSYYTGTINLIQVVE